MEEQTPFSTVPSLLQVSQDLHIHSIFSHLDSAVVPEQTLDLIAKIAHARTIGISDHFDNLAEGGTVERYIRAVREHGFRVGTEICAAEWIADAVQRPFEYFVFHCADRASEYAGAERLLETGRPVIIAHPQMMGTDLGRAPSGCLVEINNRYVCRNDWRASYTPYLSRFRFVLSSDAHQPNWLNQNVARYVARELGIRETLVFPAPDEES